MSRRARAPGPSSTISARSRGSGSWSIALRKAVWISGSPSIWMHDGAVTAYGVGAGGLGEKYRQRRNVGVPLHQSGEVAEARQRPAVQRPDLLDDGRPVIVDEHGLLARAIDRVAGEMDLAHDARGQCVEVRAGVEAEIVGAHVDVVH